MTTLSPRELTERLLLGALREQDSATLARAAARRARHVSDVIRSLGRTLDEQATRDRVRRVRLLRRDTWSMLELVEADGSIHRLPASHPSRAKRAAAESLERSWPAAGAPIEPYPRVLTPTSGRALAEALRDTESLTVLNAIGFGSLLVVPLNRNGVRIGAITFVSPEGEPPFAGDEIALAREVAAYCGMALANARLYTEARSLRQIADDANYAKSRFLSAISHELRTPLNAIGGYVELIALGLHGPVTAPQGAALARVKINQQHLLTLINELLDHARLEGGSFAYRHERVSLSAVRQRVVSMLSGLADARGVSLEAPPAADVHAAADSERLCQILVNLVTNAIKYGSPGGGSVVVTLGADERSAIISVADTGPGIPEVQRERIFLPFVQLAADRPDGLGLGLAISRELALGMEGSLTLESSEKGSVFTLTVPLAEMP